MGFLAPWFLAGVVAAGLPVYLHLLQRHTATPHSFSSLMFFEKRTQSSIKHRRLKYLLLFAMRCLFVALLVLAFARPYVHSTTIARANGGRTMMFAIDNSFSMRQGGRFAAKIQLRRRPHVSREGLIWPVDVLPEFRAKLPGSSHVVHLARWRIFALPSHSRSWGPVRL